MKLYNSMSPNGFRVDAFLAEKKIEVPTIEVSVMNGETRKHPHLARNSLGEIPVLELDDGTFICESIAICRFFEEQKPDPALFGKTPEQKAIVEMWNRRVEHIIFHSVGSIPLHESPMFADKIEQSADYAKKQRQQFVKNLSWFNQELDDQREFIAGDSYSVADITGTAALIICHFFEIEIPESAPNVLRWADRMRTRDTWPF